MRGGVGGRTHRCLVPVNRRVFSGFGKGGGVEGVGGGGRVVFFGGKRGVEKRVMCVPTIFVHVCTCVCMLVDMYLFAFRLVLVCVFEHSIPGYVCEVRLSLC